MDDETRESVLQGVEGVLLGNTLQQSHEDWREYKLANGWIYGPVKDLAVKQHPNLVPYNELPAAELLKDHLFMAIAHILGSRS